MRFRGASVILGIKNRLKLPSEDLETTGPYERKMSYGNSTKRVVVTYTFDEKYGKEKLRLERGFFKQEMEFNNDDQAVHIIKVASDKIIQMLEKE